MTTEEDFQKALDAHPDDAHTRLVFADWLEERDDVRAEGYRAMGLLRRQPVPTAETIHDDREKHWEFPGFVTADYAGEHSDNELRLATLPDDWHTLVPYWDGEMGLDRRWKCRKSRRAIEDATATAFAQLPAARREELLAGGVPS